MIGSNDTSNDYTYDDDKEDYVGSDQEGENEPDLNLLHQKGMDIHSFTDLAKKLEAHRLKNSWTEDRMEVPNESVANSDVNLEAITPPSVTPTDQGFAIDNWLRMQNEQDIQNVGSNGRLTDGEAQKRKRQPKSVSQPKESDAGFTPHLIDELRKKQIELVNQQLETQHRLQENAMFERENIAIKREELMERIALVKAKRQIVELGLKQKQNEMN